MICNCMYPTFQHYTITGHAYSCPVEQVAFKEMQIELTLLWRNDKERKAKEKPKQEAKE